MTIALISDVHANLPALEAVLEELSGVDRILHAGDVVGYGPHPSGVIEKFKEFDIQSVQGNHDRGVQDPTSIDFPETPAKAIQWTSEQITSGEALYLSELPLEKSISQGNLGLRIVHGAPEQPDRYIYPEDITSDLLSSEEVLVHGHTHVQVARSFEEGTIVNPGSVGFPRDGDPRPAFALLHQEGPRIELQRTDYNVGPVLTDIRKSGLPQRVASLLTPDGSNRT